MYEFSKSVCGRCFAIKEMPDASFFKEKSPGYAFKRTTLEGFSYASLEHDSNTFYSVRGAPTYEKIGSIFANPHPNSKELDISKYTDELDGGKALGNVPVDSRLIALGYAVSISNQVRDEGIYIAYSAPAMAIRSTNGSVHLTEYAKESKFLTELEAWQLIGKEVGSYFGMSILFIDVNQDG
ncbi:hypothetical protein Ciccas_011181 [Cichlidogyrus casuarinus]|uniref:Uncharacterized protein n=1 Tax=Cichlidogyrus casuarinus TaxID=1844966 RepID=A0ABD2PST2_9PLAT